MAVNKTAGVTKVKAGSASKKAAGLKKAAPTKAKTSRRPLPRRPKPTLASEKTAIKEGARPRRLRAPS